MFGLLGITLDKGKQRSRSVDTMISSWTGLELMRSTRFGLDWHTVSAHGCGEHPNQSKIKAASKADGA